MKYKSSEIDTHIYSQLICYQVKWKPLNCVWLFATPWTILYWNSPGQNTEAGSLSLLQEIFPTQGLNPGLQHCRQILHQLSHKGTPVVEWAANPFSSSSFWPRNRTRVSWIVGEFFTNWAIREALATKISKAPSQSIFNIFSTTWKTVSLNHDLIPSSMGKENLISRGKQKILLCP